MIDEVPPCQRRSYRTDRRTNAPSRVVASLLLLLLLFAQNMLSRSSTAYLPPDWSRETLMSNA